MKTVREFSIAASNFESRLNSLNHSKYVINCITSILMNLFDLFHRLVQSHFKFYPVKISIYLNYNQVPIQCDDGKLNWLIFFIFPITQILVFTLVRFLKGSTFPNPRAEMIKNPFPN